MQFMLDKGRSWSHTGLTLAIGAAIVSIILAFADGIFRGPLSIRYARVTDFDYSGLLTMFGVWCYDLRQVSDNLIFVGIVLFIGAKFFETRTIFTVGFDNMDAAKVSMKGPDSDNIVWIGHRYGTRLEAETVAATIESRLKDSAA